MREITDKVLNHSKDYFKNFGFAEEQIELLMDKGKQDLESLINETEDILNNPNLNLELLDNKLHALKGLILQLGATKIANEINENRNYLNDNQTIDNLKNILFK